MAPSKSEPIKLDGKHMHVDRREDNHPTTLHPVRTRPLVPPKDDLWDALDAALPPLKEGDVIAITSKIVAIDQGRCVATETVRDKEELVAGEADAWIPKKLSRYGITLSIKFGALIASAGIDASNAHGHFILPPVRPMEAASAIGRRLKKLHGLSRLGVVLTDSHCIPMRRGTVGISVGFYGFEGLRDYRGRPDIFGRPLEVTISNQPDAIAAAAVGLMGEGSECVPVVILRNWPDLVFNDNVGQDGFLIAPQDDIFAILLDAFKVHGHIKGSDTRR